jgi:hypothetical protein
MFYPEFPASTKHTLFVLDEDQLMSSNIVKWVLYIKFLLNSVIACRRIVC